MSLSRRDSEFANSGLMITLEPEQFGSTHALAGMMLQRRYEQRAYEIGARGLPLPDSNTCTIFSAAALARATCHPAIRVSWWGPIWRSWFRLRSSRHSIGHCLCWTVAGGEISCEMPRWWAPRRGAVRRCAFRATRQHSKATGYGGLYPVGEGAGYAGGIVSAALDGLRAAKAIIRRYAPLERR